MERVSCAIAGLGRIGWLLEEDPLREKPATHAGAAEALPEVILSAGADPDRERRLGFKQRYPQAAVYSSVREMLEADLPDILVVATPPSTHRQLVEAAAESKVAVIVCEKPLAENSSDGEALLECCRRHGSRLLVNHERRYSADYLYARTIIDEKKHGELCSVQARVYMGEKRTPLEILYDDGTHMLDIIRFLCGGDWELSGCFGDGSRRGAGLRLVMACGSVPVYLEVGAGRQQLEFELELSFQRGRLRIGNGVLEEAAAVASRWYSGFYSLEPVPLPRVQDKGYFTGMMADAVRCVRQPERQPRSSGLDGLAAVQLMDRISAACRMDRV